MGPSLYDKIKDIQKLITDNHIFIPISSLITPVQCLACNYYYKYKDYNIYGLLYSSKRHIINHINTKYHKLAVIGYNDKLINDKLQSEYNNLYDEIIKQKL